MTHADVVVENGTVRTMDAAGTVTDAVAITDGVITAVGRDAAAAQRGPHTTTIDLAGRTALPGFQDAHIHPTQGGLSRLRCNLSDVHGFQATAIKIMQDGVCENLTGAMLSPYRGQGDERGLSFIDPDVLCDVVTRLTAQRFDVHIHAVGDRAVREAVNAFEAAAGPDDLRRQIAHIDIIHADEIGRMGRQRIIANVQPLWARQDSVLVDTKLPFLTHDQQARHFAFRALRDAGAPLALGSDWPVSSPDPLWGIHVAVNRTAPHADPHAQDHTAQHDPLLPAQAIAVDDAVRGYTTGAAYANRLDDRTGMLEAGKAGDIVVLDADPYTVPADSLSDIRVAMTLAGGQVVYEV